MVPNREKWNYLSKPSALFRGIISKHCGEKKNKKQKEGFLRMLLDTLGASLLANILSGKISTGEGIIRADQDF